MFQTYQRIGCFVKNARSKYIKKQTQHETPTPQAIPSGPKARRKRSPKGAESPTEARNDGESGKMHQKKKKA
jgi:hypothetical protein